MSTAAAEARVRLIEALAQDQVNSFSGASDGWSQLESVFREGFTGFENMSDGELVQAAKDSGVAREFKEDVATLEHAHAEEVRTAATRAGQSDIGAAISSTAKPDNDDVLKDPRFREALEDYLETWRTFPIPAGYVKPSFDGWYESVVLGRRGS